MIEKEIILYKPKHKANQPPMAMTSDRAQYNYAIITIHKQLKHRGKYLDARSLAKKEREGLEYKLEAIEAEVVELFKNFKLYKNYGLRDAYELKLEAYDNIRYELVPVISNPVEIIVEEWRLPNGRIPTKKIIKGIAAAYKNMGFRQLTNKQYEKFFNKIDNHKKSLKRKRAKIKTKKGG